MLPLITRPSATGSTGWRAAPRAKKNSIHAIATTVRTMTAAVADENSPKAMPEFCTCRIQNSPTTWTPSSSASCDTTMCFVSWSAATAARTIATSDSQWLGPAPSFRSATDTGASAFGDEPTRTSARRVSVTGAAPSPAQLGVPRVVDAERRPGPRLEPLEADLLAALDALAVRAVVDAL